MSDKLTYGLYDFFEKDELTIFYLGDFIDRSLLALTDLITSYDDKSNTLGTLKKKIVYLIIESFQNVIRYSLNSELHSFFMTRKIKDSYYISTANVISDAGIIDLKERIDSLNIMDGKELKEKYKEILLNKKFSEAGGAGLGLVEISRKTMQKIDYHFETLSNDETIFYFLLKYLKENADSCTDAVEVKHIYNFFRANNIILFFKHEFDESITEAVLRTAELNFKTTDERQKKLAFHLSVEVLQNLSIHAYEVNGKRNGIFYVQEYSDGYFIKIGNFVHNYDIKDLNTFLKILKNSTKEDLNHLYKEQLVADEFDGNGGLGFIDIAREAKEFNFKFFEINDEYSFFAFSFKI